MKHHFFHYSFRAIKFSLRNFIRALFFITAVVSMLLAAGWFAALKYFNADNVGLTITRILQNAFDRPVVMGSIKLKSINAIEISGLKVIDNTLNIYNELASAGSVIIRYDLMPLFENRVEIKEVILKDISINIIKDANGNYNTPKLNITSSESSLGQSFSLTQGGRKIDIVIEDWAIENGTVSYRDLQQNISHSLNGIKIEFENLKFNNETPYSLNFVLRNNFKDKIIETEIVSEGKINLANFSPSAMSLKDAKTEIRGFKKPLSFFINADNFLNPQISFSGQIPAFSYDDVSLFLQKQYNFQIPATKIKSDISISNNFKTVSFKNASAKNKDINLKADINLDFTGPQGLSAVKFSTDDFNITAADYLGLLSEYKLKGVVSAKGEAVFNGKTPSLPKLSLDLKGVNAFVSNFTIENVKAVVNINNNLNDWSAVVADGIFKVGRQTVSQIKGTAAYEHKKQNFYALLNNSKFNEKIIKLSVSISNVRNEAKRTIKSLLYVNKFEPLEVFDTVEDFVKALSDGHMSYAHDSGDLAWLHNFKNGIPTFMPNFNGLIYADEFYTPIIAGKTFNAEFNLRNMLPGMDKLNGKIDATLESGVIYKLQETADRYSALGVAFQPFVIMNNMERAGSFKMGKVLKDTPFDTMTLSVDFNNGKMDINNFYASGNVIAASVSGDVDWVGESLNLDIVTMFKNTSKRGVLSENLTDESGEPALAFRTYGPMKKPSVQVRSPKKTGAKIKEAEKKGVRTDFSAGREFFKGEKNVKKTAN